MKKRALGKGLSALVQENIVEPLVEIVPDIQQIQAGINQGSVFMIAVEKILPSRYQPRKEFDESFLEELSDSIRRYGVIQPLVVSDLGDDCFELVAGERRLRASKLAGLIEVPVVIREFEERDRLAVALIENIQRADLNAIEVAEAYQEMIDRLDLTQEEVSQMVGKSRTSVTNTLRLLKLPQSVRVKILNKNFSEGHGRALLALSDLRVMEQVAHFIEQNDWSVRQVEEYVRKLNSTNNENRDEMVGKFEPPSHRMKALEEKIIRDLGIKTKLNGSLEKGSIRLFYYSEDELQNILESILNNPHKN